MGVRRSLSFSLLYFFILVLPAAFSLKQCKFPAVFNFGDSNSDTGGFSAAFRPALPPNGETFFHSPAGRFSDGRLVIDFIGSIFSQLLPKDEEFSEALYTFDIGQNDLTAGYKLNLTTDEVKAYVPDLLDQLSAAIKDVYGQGGRSCWIHNTGPVGCLPYILDRYIVNASQYDKHGCAIPFNDVAQYFNRGLKETLAVLRKELPLAAITYIDVYSAKYTLISQAKRYGFGNPLVACCGHGGKYNFNNNARCGAKITVHGKEILIANSCPNPTLGIIWDGIHYTEAANKWIFERIADGSFSDPPMPLKLACHRI